MKKKVQGVNGLLEELMNKHAQGLYVSFDEFVEAFRQQADVLDQLLAELDEEITKTKCAQ